MLPGVHRVRCKVATGLAEYWYAWRGGPRILAERAGDAQELDRKVAAASAAAGAQYRLLVRPEASDAFLSGLIVRYLASGEYARLAKRTKADLSRHLSTAREDLGAMPVEALKADGARKALLDWRDGVKAHPRTADARMSALAQAIGWAKKRGDIPVDPLKDWPRIYKTNRAEVIWTKSDLVKLLRGADADFRRAVLMAAFTGLRIGDLVRLTWADVGDKGINFRTAKTGRIVVVPLEPKVSAVLRQIGRKDVGAVLTHSRGKPWTVWGLQTAMQRAKAARKMTGLRFHDLRGTAATHFIRSGLPLVDVAGIMAWAPSRIGDIARRYVTSEAIAEGMLTRLEENRRRPGL